MATQGNVSSADALPYAERLYTDQWNGRAVNVGGQADFTLDSFAMPFAGNLICEIEWSWSWTHYQQLSMSPVPSPAANWMSQWWHIIGYSEGYCYHVAYQMLMWSALTQGQTVSAAVRVYVGGGETAASSDWLSVNWRAYRT